MTMASPRAQAGTTTRYGVVGVGRVGAAVAARLLDAERTVAAVTARSETARRRARAFAPGARVGTVAEVVASTDVVVLAVPDDALADVAEQAAAHVRPGQVVAHTSGRFGAGVLAACAAAGARAIALHPAMTFTGAAAHADDRRFAVGVTAAPADRELAHDLARVLGGEPVDVAEGDRIGYHAALSHGANHLVTLVAQSRDVLAAAGAGQYAELVLRPLLEAALDNALRDGDAALTGPVARGDAGTVRAHLDVLAGTQPEAAYRALATATVERARDDARLEPTSADRLLAVIGGTR